MPRARPSVPPDPLPNLGLVCLSSDEQCRFRTITLSRYRSLPPDVADLQLRTIYWDNVQRLHWTLGYCARRHINLYRMTSALFPMSDEPAGEATLRSMASMLAAIGRRAAAMRIRVVLHPDQFVVLNSDNEKTRATSVKILEKHALAMDLMGLPQSTWSLMNIHGGKAGNGDALVEIIKTLPPTVRDRLTLENDEYSYGAAEIYDICRRANVPMVFDCHHHVIKEGLATYDDPSVERFSELARETWRPNEALQLAHVSNGETAFLDRYHGEFVTMMPRAFAHVPWIEVEARGKERAIAALHSQWPMSAKPPKGFPIHKPTAAEKRDAAVAAEATAE